MTTRMMWTLAFGLTVGAGAIAATPKPMSLDTSADFLMDSVTAEKIWKENVPGSVVKLYPRTKFRFASQISGGFTTGKICVVTARAMLLPVVRLPVQGAKVVYAPVTSATAFDTLEGASDAQCRDLAKAKLKEAVQSVAASLAAT